MKLRANIAGARLKLALRLSRLNRRLAPIPPLVMEQVCFFGGLASVAYGCWLVYPPAGYIVGGSLLVWLATLISAERMK